MKNDSTYLILIRDAINQIFAYVGQTDKEGFLQYDLLKETCLTRLMVIGEYGGKVSAATKERFPDVEWQLMKATRKFTYMFTRK